MEKILTFNDFLIQESASADKLLSDDQYLIMYALSSNMPGDKVPKDGLGDFAGTKKESYANLLHMDIRSTWGDVAEMNPGTVTRMQSQYNLLLRGNRKGIPSQTLFPLARPDVCQVAGVVPVRYHLHDLHLLL
jgi:hypothetical protein